MAGKLFGVDFQKTIYSGFKGKLRPGTLEVEALAAATDRLGDRVSNTTSEPVEGFVGRFDERTRVDRGYDLKVAKITLLARGPNGPITSPRDRTAYVTIDGARYAVRDVTIPAGEAIYTMAGTPA